MLSIDSNILRVARKIAAIQRVRPQNVLVPREIVVAGHDLDRAHTLARKVLRGDDQASEQLVAKIGGSSPLPRGYRSESRAPSPRAAALIGMAQAGPIHGGPCLDHVRGDLELLQAAFRLDVQRHHRDGRLTTRAARFVRERRDKLAEFERELDRPSMDIAETRPRGVRSPRGATPTRGGRPLDRGNVPITDAEPGIPRGRQPPPNRTRLLPPDADVPDVGDPFEPGLDLDSCLELGDICVQLFNDFARASLADDDAQLIALVEPNCLCVDDFDDNTVFTARPDANRNLPAQQGDYRLIFRGADITDRIRPGAWSPKEIQFTIPAQSFTGYVYLRRFINTVSGGLGRTLSNLCGIPDLGVPGGGLSPSPRAIISIVRPPVIEAFSVKGNAGNRVVTEACTAVTFVWAVRLEDQSLGQLLPPCGVIEIAIQDEQGNLLHPSTEAIGEWTTNPTQSMRYRVIARSLAGQKRCGEVQSGWMEVVREHRLYVEPAEPSTPFIVGGKTGTLTVRLSCPAPPEGAQVQLLSDDRNILRLPDSVLVFPGERSAPVQFSTSRDQYGNVMITARLANHIDGTLQYLVLENLTAIVLSGGGAKGSFEVGALLYLREIWNEVRPRIICGTSVGAINALALAEAPDARGVDKVERIWLGLQYYGDMYKPSPELRSALDAAEIPFEDFVAVLNEQEGASLDFGLLNLIDESEAAAWAVAGWAIGGPVGAIGAGLASIFGGAGGQ